MRLKTAQTKIDYGLAIYKIFLLSHETKTTATTKMAATSTMTATTTATAMATATIMTTTTTSTSGQL